jgi:hypothetical protein
MTAAAWVIGLATLVGVGLTYFVARANGYDRGFAKGYTAGQLHEREALGRIIDGERQRALAAQDDIDYLYERTRWRIMEEDRGSFDRGNGDEWAPRS